MLFHFLGEFYTLYTFRYDQKLQKIINFLKHDLERVVTFYFPQQVRANKKKQVQVSQFLEDVY